MEQIREFTVYGCPYCIGPIYFMLEDAEKHISDAHNLDVPVWAL